MRSGPYAALVAVLLIGLVSTFGVVIFHEVENRMPMPGGERQELAVEVQSGFASSLDLLPLVFLALLFLVTLGVITRG